MTSRLTGRLAAQLGLAVGVLAGIGVLAGLVWEWVWTPTIGVVVDHRWSPGDAIGLQQEFSGTGWYVVVGIAAGLVAGTLVALVAARVPLLTLVVVVLGSAVGAWLMLRVGTAVGPADPQVAAKTASDGTRLPGALTVSGHSPWLAYPLGALLGLLVVFVGLTPRGLRSGAADRGEDGPGDGDEVGGGDLQVETTTPGGDEDGVER